MLKRPILTAVFMGMIFITSIGVVSNEHVQVSIFGKNIAPLSGLVLIHPVRVEPKVYRANPIAAISTGVASFVGKSGQWSYCDYTLPANPVYEVELVTTDVDKEITGGEVFMVNMTFKNNGNTRLFSSRSGCEGMKIFNVGTQGAGDRLSRFGLSSVAMSGWTSPNRIKMLNNYADPGDVFQVMFQSIAPSGDNIYREWFQPVVENVAWLSSAFSLDISVGTPTEEMTKNMGFAKDPITIAASDMVGKAKSFTIDLSDQTMTVNFGDKAVWKMRISSGASATPTPVGSFPITSKQELRIAGKAPHYRMPYFMMWRKDGYGTHALPYLANDGGTFWNEARDHIGIPVSHGCIRVLPEDAVIIYAFAEIGTPFNIQY